MVFLIIRRIFLFLFIFLLFIAGIEDIKYKGINVYIIVLMSAISIILFFSRVDSVENLSFLFFEAVLPGILLIIIALLSEQIGLADGFFCLEAGLILGMKGLIKILIISSILCFFVSLFLIYSKKISLKEKIPFYPFITFSFIIVTLI